MTTIIATKDSILSDGKVTVGGRVDQLNFCKVRKIGNYLVGGAGRVTSVLRFFDWFSTKIHAEDLQSMSDILVIDIPQDERDEEFTALIVTPDGRILYHEGNDVTRVLECSGDYYAIGSGSDYALAALDAGATPEAAMEVAKYRDCYSGGETFKVEFEEQLTIPETREEASELTREQLLDIVYGKVKLAEQDEPVSTPEEDAMQELVEVSQDLDLYNGKGLPEETGPGSACIHEYIYDTSTQLLTHPPKHKGVCKFCGKITYTESSSVSENLWVENTGEQPVYDDVEVEVILCNGEMGTGGNAEDWRWNLSGSGDDILKWRLHNA